MPPTHLKIVPVQRKGRKKTETETEGKSILRPPHQGFIPSVKTKPPGSFVLLLTNYTSCSAIKVPLASLTIFISSSTISSLRSQICNIYASNVLIKVIDCDVSPTKRVGKVNSGTLSPQTQIKKEKTRNAQ